MALLIDANNVFFTEMIKFHAAEKEQPTMQDVRNLCGRRIIEICRDFKKYGETVLIYDGRDYWRKGIFQHYKSGRKKLRDNSTLDWNALYKHLNQFQEELKDNFPIKVLNVHEAEADDVIAILALRLAANGEDVMIYCTDNDILQLQFITKKIKQFSYIKKKTITPESEKYTLFEHIVRGDSNDGIPNILSRNDHFANPTGKRQKAIRLDKLQDWERHGISNPEAFCDEQMLERFKENRTLVDFSKIPRRISDRIIEAYDEAKPAKGKMFTYMVENRLTELLKEGGF